MKPLKKILVTIFVSCSFFISVSSTAAAAEYDYYSVIYNEIANSNSSLGTDGVDWTTRAILYACSRWNVDPILATALFKSESNFSNSSISSVGAIGIGQLMPDTAAALGVDPTNPLENIDGSVHYLRQQLDRFSGDGAYAATYAIAAYNAGPRAVQKYGGVPPYPETINYVKKVSYYYSEMM